MTLAQQIEALGITGITFIKDTTDQEYGDICHRVELSYKGVLIEVVSRIHEKKPKILFFLVAKPTKYKHIYHDYKAEKPNDVYKLTKNAVINWLEYLAKEDAYYSNIYNTAMDDFNATVDRLKALGVQFPESIYNHGSSHTISHEQKPFELRIEVNIPHISSRLNLDTYMIPDYISFLELAKKIDFSKVTD